MRMAEEIIAKAEQVAKDIRKDADVMQMEFWLIWRLF
jgi:hypothetical protein